ncbi:MAG: ABC transporter permease [Syntrophorhabdaceae bacterium]|nr:ABC transporter permease [Syntrophorhabdaceae bacterium]MDD4197033.1 ABC transporter permease [Syntrophorhabdaceae bacterium]
MNLNRVWAMARKETIQIRRDPLSLALAFLLPLILLFIFGYAITVDVDRLPTVVYDRDLSSMSREVVRGLQASGYFTIVEYVQDPARVDAALDRGSAQVAISFPEDFSRHARTGRATQLQVIVDGSDSNTATIALGYLNTALELAARRAGLYSIVPVIDVRPRVWYNPELKSRNFIVPGLIAVIMAIIAALLTSLTVAREWERGTMEQIISTPVKPAEIIIGKLMPYFAIGIIDTVLAIVIVVFLFGVPLKGSFFLLLFISCLFLFGGLSLGILISIVTKSQLASSQVALITSYLPALLLSGFMFSILNMPVPLQIITRFIPARYFVSAIKGIFLKGNTAGMLLSEMGLLALFGALAFFIAIKKFKKRVT